MRIRAYTAVLLFVVSSSPVWPQSAPPAKPEEKPPEVMPYANMPEVAVPFGRYRKAYYDWFVRPDTLQYFGAARVRPDGNLTELKTINLGFLGPLGENNPDSLYGIPMLHGAELAIEEANARGSYDGKPFALKVHDDLPLWGASSMEIVKMDFDEHVWGMLGSIDGASTHIALRATLKLEIPIVDTGTTDPTVTETRVQWLLHDFPDDRQQGYALADYIFNQLKLQRIGLMRSTDRYGRKGDEIFLSVARRIGRQPLIEAKFEPTDTSFTKQLRLFRGTGIDGLVIWGNARQAALILKQMRAMGMKQPVFGSSRIAYPEVVKMAGPAAEGLVAVCPMDPSRQDPKWVEFREAYLKRFHAEPDPFASYAFDGMNLLIAAVRKAGLNRGRIMDALREHAMKEYQGASGTAFFDYTLNNIAPVNFAQVKNGRFVYWLDRRTDRKEIQPVAGLR
jgi:branched-chain amino acid transport system substrate-binding protein